MYSLFCTSWFGKLLALVTGKSPNPSLRVAHRVRADDCRGCRIPANSAIAAVADRPPAEVHEFFGQHLLASYVGCDPAALADHRGLMHALREAIKASGATLLSELSNEFSPAGMTAAMLLSESHASIHTYPEHRACFVELFTC